MLQAMLSGNKPIIAAEFHRHQIRALKNQLFYCPVCQERVILKAGELMIPHFAHYPKSDCQLSSGGEGIYHEEGKLQLYQWLRSQGYKVHLEYYLPDIKQRPDLLLKLQNGKQIAIEYQCASISEKQFSERNKGYLSRNIKPLWILGGNRLKRSGAFRFKLNQSAMPFLQNYSDDQAPQLLFYCAETESFCLARQLYLTGSSEIIGSLQFAKLTQLQFPALFRATAVPSFSHKRIGLWFASQQRYRNRPASNPSLFEEAWRKLLYDRYLHPSILRYIIHLPVKNQYLMRVPPWIWQGNLWLQRLESLQAGEQVKLEDLEPIIAPFQQQRSFPFLQSALTPLEAYMKLLTALNLFEQLSPQRYIKKSEAGLAASALSIRKERQQLEAFFADKESKSSHE